MGLENVTQNAEKYLSDAGINKNKLYPEARKNL